MSLFFVIYFIFIISLPSWYLDGFAEYGNGVRLPGFLVPLGVFLHLLQSVGVEAREIAVVAVLLFLSAGVSVFMSFFFLFVCL